MVSLLFVSNVGTHKGIQRSLLYVTTVSLFADWLLERVHAICKYYGPAGLQRLLSGKPNHCGHYYYGTLSMQF